MAKKLVTLDRLATFLDQMKGLIPEPSASYSTGTATEAGITKLYTETGSNTDGAMTQAAVTELVGDIESLLAAI